MTSRWTLAPALAFGLALTASAACRSAAPAAPPQAPTAPVVAPATRPPESIRWTRDSAEHRALFLQVYRAATAHVEREAAARAPGTWAVVLDADETVIDNSLYQLERARAGKPFDAESWHAWCARREAVPLPGAHGVPRPGPGTRREGRDRHQPHRQRVPGHRGGVPRPRARLRRDALQAGRRAERQGTRASRRSRAARPRSGLPPLEVVSFVGDNIQDFPGLSQAVRKEADEAFAAFGARFFVLPNPMYGSWERN